jgi:hypothetical protein
MLRTLLAALDLAARRVLAADPAAMGALRDAMRTLDTIFRAHLTLEESILPPPIVARLNREHREQRSMLEAILAEVEHDTRDPMRVAEDARWLVAVLSRDMDAEDVAFARLSADARAEGTP